MSASTKEELISNSFFTSRAANWKLVLVYLALAVSVLYPLAFVQVPGFVDYPNHLARMHILSQIENSADLRQFYQVHWHAIPYLAMDAAFVVLGRIMPIYDAGRVFLGICILLPVAAVAALHYAVHRRASLVPAAAFLLSYNLLLSWAFLNFLVSCSLAVLLFAGWVATVGRARWPRALAFAVLSMALYLCHLVAFSCFLLMLGGFELARAWRAGFRPWPVILGDWLAAALQLVPAVLLALIVEKEAVLVGPVVTVYGDLHTKLTALMSPVLFLDWRLSALTAACAAGVLIIGLRTGRVRLAPAILPAALVVGLVALCLPSEFVGIFGMDFRLPLVVAMLLLASVSVTDRAGRGMRAAVLASIMLLVAGRSAVTASALQEMDGQIAQMRQVLAALPRGMRLLTVDTSGGEHRLRPGARKVSWHAPTLAVIDRDAYVPTLFSGVITVRVVPELRRSSSPNGWRYPSLADFVDGYGRRDDPAVDLADGFGGRIYWLGWETKFDYVLVEHYGRRPASLPANLTPVAASDVADLYRIDPTPSP